MRRSVLLRPALWHYLNQGSSHQAPSQRACTNPLLYSCFKQPILILGNSQLGSRQYAQPAAANEQAAEGSVGQPEDEDFKLMQAVLSRTGPSAEMREAHRTEEVQRFRFGDLPVTTQWMESFVASGSSGGYSATGNPGPQSGDALYDIPAWLEANVPAHDTTPKSPLYHWVAWMQQHLPPDQRRLYLALHEHMQHEPRRQAIMAKAQYELACLWDWQHRRVAAGLPADWTAQEQQVARKAAVAEGAKEAAALQAAATAARARAASEAHMAAFGRPIQSSSSSSSSSSKGGRSGGAAAVAASALEREAAGVRAGVAKAEAAVADAQRWLIEDPSSAAMVPDMQEALRAARDAASQCSAAAAKGDAKAVQQAASAADRASGLAHRMAAAIAPHWVQGVQEAAAEGAGAVAESKSKKRQESRAANSSSKQKESITQQQSQLTGMSSFLKRAELREEEAERQRKEAVHKLAQHLGLTAREQALLRSLDVDATAMLHARTEGSGVGSSDGGVGLQPLLSGFMARIENGKRLMAGTSSSTSRAVAMLRSHSDTRAREEAEHADAMSLMGMAERAASSPGTSGSGSGSATAQHRKPQLGSLELAAQAKLVQQRAQDVREQQAKHGKAEQSAALEARQLSWSQLPAFNHQVTLEHMAEQRQDRELVVQRKLLADSQVLDLGSPPPYSPDPLYRLPYRFSLGVRPPTATLDLVLDYLQVKYQDVLLRRDLTQRVWAEMGPRTAAAPPPQPAPAAGGTAMPSSSSSGGGGGSSGGVQLGHWSGRLSAEQVARLNARMQQLFEAGQAQPYTRLMQRLARQGLLSESELAEHVAAVTLRARELSVEQEAARTAAAPGAPAALATDGPISPQLQAHLLAGLTGEGSSAVGGFGRSRPFVELEEARRAWDASWSAGQQQGPSYTDWAAAMAEAAQPPSAHDVPAGALAPEGAAEQAAAVQAWWHKGQGAAPPSFEEARTAWQQYVDLAGSPPDAPLLEDVLLADDTLRVARAAHAAPGSGAPAEARLQAAEQRAEALNAATARLFRSFVARNGTATVPLPGQLAADSSSGGTSASARSSSSSSPADGRQPWAVAGGSMDPAQAWQAVDALNRALNPLLPRATTTHQGSGSGKDSRSSVLTMFQGALRVPELLRTHWERVGRAFLRTRLAWSSAPEWEQLWGLMTALHRHTSPPAPSATTASQRSSGAGAQPKAGSEAQQPRAKASTPYAAAGLSPASRELLSKLQNNNSTNDKKVDEGGSAAAAAELQPDVAVKPQQQTPALNHQQQQQASQDAAASHAQAAAAAGHADPDAELQPEFLAAVGPAAPAQPQVSAEVAAASEAERRARKLSEQWQAYTAAQRQRAEVEAAQGQAWPVAPQLAPPYPGARPIVRFQQSIILGPASALTSTQGLADRLAAREASDAAHPATQGLGSPSVLLPDHPSSKRVTMKVKMSELAEEMGLKQHTVVLMKKVVGPSMYDSKTDDLTIVCALHPTREENRRWCMERLHLLAAEAHAASVQTAKEPLRGLVNWE